MRRALVVSLFAISLSASAAGDDVDPALARIHFHVGVTVLFGPATATTPNVYGVGGVIEPKYAVTDHFLAGLRFEGGAMLGGGATGTTSVNFGTRIPDLAALKAEYAFGSGERGWFLGLDAGYYSVSASFGGRTATTLGSIYGFGFAPQVGLDFPTFRLAAQYHLLASDFRASFLGVEVSWRGL